MLFLHSYWTYFHTCHFEGRIRNRLGFSYRKMTLIIFQGNVFKGKGKGKVESESRKDGFIEVEK